MTSDSNAGMPGDLSSHLFDLSPVPITVVDRQGRIVRANAEAERVLGLTRGDITRRSYNDPGWRITDYEGNPFPDERLPVRQVLDSGRAVYGVEHAIEKPDRERAYLSINAAPVWTGEGELSHVVCMVRDVTEQRKTEAALREREQRFRALFEQSLDAIWIVAFDGSILEVNQAWLDMFGFRREEVVCLNAADFYAAPDGRQQFLSKIRRQGFVRDVVQFLRKDGSVFDCERTVVPLRDDAGAIVGFQGVARDVTEQRRAEAALRESEERFRVVFESSPIGIALVETPSQRFIQANPSFLALVGYDEEELYGLTTLDITHPDDREMERRAVQAYYESDRAENFVLEKRYVRKDGSVRQVVLQGGQVVLGADRLVLAVASVLDVTEERRIQAQLRESEKRYRLLFEQAGEAGTIVTPDGWVTDANEAFLDLFGYSRDELPGLHVSTLHADPAERESFLRKMTAEGSVRDEVWYRKHSGELFLCERSVTGIRNERGEFVAFQSFVRDVTERRRMERALQESEKKYRSLFEQSREAITVVSPDGTVLDANQAWLDLFGYQRHELRALNIVAIYDDPRRRTDFLRRIAAAGFVHDELWYRRRDGTPILCERTVSSWKDDDGKTVAFQAFAHDVTSQRRMEAELHAQADQLRLLARRVQAAREEERTGIARELHDRIGQELTALKLDLHRLKAGLRHEESAHAGELDGIEHLLDETADDVRRISSELRPGVLDEIGLAGAIDWQVDELKRRTVIHYDVSLPDAIPELDEARRTALFRVFQELMTNVVRHADATSVRVSLEQERDAVVKMTVADDGRGVASQQTEGPASLGVVGMRERLQPFGGTLEYESAPGRGTVARVSMPLC